MKKNITKLFVVVLFLFLTITLSGCDLLENKEPDSEIAEITTNEEGYDFILDKLSTINYFKASVKYSIVGLPLEGHLDWNDKKTFILIYGNNENSERIVTHSYFYDDKQVYIYENKDNEEKYRTVNIDNPTGTGFDLNRYIKYLQKGNVNFDEVTLNNESYQFTLSFTTGEEKLHIIYSYDTIKIKIEGLATITLSEDNPNYFDELNFDFTKYSE